MADAVDTKPRFIPLDDLRARDDSGGGRVFGWETYNAEYGDGPHTRGPGVGGSGGSKGERRDKGRDKDRD